MSTPSNLSPVPRAAPVRARHPRHAVDLLAYYLVGGGAAVMAVFVAIAAGVRRGAWITRDDGPVLDWFVHHRNGFLTSAAKAVSVVADPVGTGAVAVLAAAFVVMRFNDRAGAVYLVATAGVSGVVVLVAKHLAGRQRPPVVSQLVVESNGSFPSGHAVGAVAVYGAIGVLLAVRASRPAGRVSTIVLVVIAVMVVAVDRLYLGVHWFSDILGATAAGLAVLLVTTSLWWDLRRPVRPTQIARTQMT